MENTTNVGLSPNTQKESMRTWRRRKETIGVLGEYAKKRHKSVYISVNNDKNLNFLKILFIYTIWNGLSQKTISCYTGPLNRLNRDKQIYSSYQLCVSSAGTEPDPRQTNV
jgi:hypothetical protein